MAIVPMCTGSLSFFSSLSIVHSFVRDLENKIKHPYHRILFEISIFDIIGSFSYILSTIPSPKDTENIYLAKGNTLTCTLQGFGIQLSFAVPYLTAVLMLYYVLTIRFGWSNEKFRKKCEVYVCSLAILWPLIFGIILLCIGAFNNTGNVCWINVIPKGCDLKGSEIACKRGLSADSILNYINSGIPLILSFLFILICAILIWHHVWGVERKMSKWTFESNLNSSFTLGNEGSSTKIRGRKAKKNPSKNRVKMNNTRKVSIQASLYVLAFIATFTPPFVKNIMSTSNVFLSLTIQVLYPLQGFWNFLIYIRPRFLRLNEICPQYPIYKRLYYAAYSKHGYEMAIRANKRMSVLRDSTRMKKSMNSSNQYSTSLS